MRELFCKYLFVGKGMELYSDPAMAPVANRRRRGNALGQPTKATTGSINRTYSYTAYGMPTGRTAGSLQDFTYDFDVQKGNLLSKKDNKKNKTETFGYDNLNRLSTIGTQQIGYAANGNITAMPGVGTLAYENSAKPYQVTMLTPTGTAVPIREQSVTYTSYQRPNTLTENGITASFAYNSAGDRVKMDVKQGTTALLTRYYIGGQYELDAQTNTERLYLGGDAYSAPAIYVKEGTGSWKTYYIFRDYLGSITHIANSDGSLKQELSYDAWGRLRNPATQVVYTPGSEPTLFLGRGYTGHEHLSWFGLINMNARLYDAALGRFLSPDPYVQMPGFSQNYNRYSYCLNNPLIYTDPSGENPVIIAAIIIGAAAGGYTGYKIAEAKGYDVGNWQTWGYMLGGAVIGGLSGYMGATIAAGGGFMANTMGIMYSSSFNSMYMSALSGGMMSPGISFGVASYDFGMGEWGYLGKKGNKWYQNLSYGFGVLANTSDMISLFRGGGQNIKVNSAKTKGVDEYGNPNDWWGHSSITDENGNSLLSVGPDSRVGKSTSLSETWQNSIKGADMGWDTYLGKKGTWSVELNNVSTTAISKYASGVTRWDLLLNSCVGHTSRALWGAGVPNIYLFHPHFLNAQLLIRQVGIYSSPYLYQIP